MNVTEDLSSALARLSELLRALPDSPSWEKIAIVENLILDPDGSSRARVLESMSPDEYAERFDALRAEGHSWINLHAAGVVWGSTLLVTVERPSLKSLRAAAATSINISGPPNFVRGRPAWSIDDLVAWRNDAVE